MTTTVTAKKLAALAGALAALLLATAAGAHVSAPQMLMSEPPDGASMSRAPGEVWALFSEPLDPSTSTMRIIDACGRRLDDGQVQVAGPRMSVGVERTPGGVYRVLWQATGIGAVGGTVTGSFSFEVTSGHPCEHGGHGDGHGGTGGGHGGDHGRHGGGHGGDHGRHGGGHGGGHGDGHSGGRGTRHQGHRSGGGAGRHEANGAHDTDHQDLIDLVTPDGPTEPDPQPPLAAAPGAPGPAAPGTQTLIVMLELAALIGALGGVVLRYSYPR
jgi:methionine-rich copper-binding protein CopC